MNFTGICYLFISVKFLQSALKAYLRKEIFLCILFSLLSFISLATGLIFIFAGFKLCMMAWGSSDASSSTNPSNGSGSNGNGNGNSNPDPLATGGGQQSDEQTYRNRKLEYLKGQETYYQRVVSKAKSSIIRLNKQKENDTTNKSYDAALEYNQAVLGKSRDRLAIARSWIRSEERQTPYIYYRQKRYNINRNSPYNLKVDK